MGERPTTFRVDLTPAQVDRMFAAGWSPGEGNAGDWLVAAAEGRDALCTAALTAIDLLTSTDHRDDGTHGRCIECSQRWPCETGQAIETLRAAVREEG